MSLWSWFFSDAAFETEHRNLVAALQRLVDLARQLDEVLLFCTVSEVHRSAGQRVQRLAPAAHRGRPDRPLDEERSREILRSHRESGLEATVRSRGESGLRHRSASRWRRRRGHRHGLTILEGVAVLHRRSAGMTELPNRGIGRMDAGRKRCLRLLERSRG